MADAGRKGRALLPEAAGQRRRQIWNVEFARYFAPPLPGTLTPPPCGLRYVSHLSKHRHPGAWLPAASPAVVCVSQPSASASAVPILTVSINDVVFEEHFVSILNFSWPQVTCVTQSPIRGSRVVFASFHDNSKQIQKFALRFPHLTDAESFINCVKECPGEAMDIISYGSQSIFEDSPASEYISDSRLQHRPDDASSFDERASDHRSEAASGHGTEAPALFYHVETDQSVLEPLRDTNIDNISSGFPPSFTEMLTNLSTKNLKDAEELYGLTATEHAPQEAYTLDTSHHVTVSSNETTGGNDIDASKSTRDLMERIKIYMADDSFHDMVFKLERVIDEVGGDLSA